MLRETVCTGKSYERRPAAQCCSDKPFGPASPGYVSHLVSPVPQGNSFLIGYSPCTYLAPTCLLNCSHTIKNNSLFSSVFSSLELVIYSHCGLKILNRKFLKKIHEFKCTVLSGVRNSSLMSLSSTQDVNPLLIQHGHTVCPTLQVAEVVTILRALLTGHISCLSGLLW